MEVESSESVGGEREREFELCRILCLPTIEGTGVPGALAAWRKAAPLAPPDLLQTLEILIEVGERIAADAEYQDQRVVWASWDLEKWMRSVGFDVEGHIRLQKAQRRHAARRNPSQKVLRLVRGAAKACGAEFGDIVAVPDIARGAAMIEVVGRPGAPTLTEVWRWFRLATPRSGLWPVFVGEIDEELPFSSSKQVLERAQDVDASQLLEDRREALGIENSLDPVPPLRTGWDTADEILGGATSTGDFGLLLVPAQRGAEALASIVWEDGNTLRTHEHVAVLGWFEQQYGAELAVIDGATIELTLAAPITDEALAMEAAKDRMGYADSTSGAQEYWELSEVFQATTQDTVWAFWWD